MADSTWGKKNRRLEELIDNMVSINELIVEVATRPVLREFREGSRTSRMDVVLLKDSVWVVRVSRLLWSPEARALSDFPNAAFPTRTSVFVLDPRSSRHGSSLWKRRGTILELPSFFYCFFLFFSFLTC